MKNTYQNKISYIILLTCFKYDKLHLINPTIYFLHNHKLSFKVFFKDTFSFSKYPTEIYGLFNNNANA